MDEGTPAPQKNRERTGKIKVVNNNNDCEVQKTFPPRRFGSNGLPRVQPKHMIYNNTPPLPVTPKIRREHENGDRE